MVRKNMRKIYLRSEIDISCMERTKKYHKNMIKIRDGKYNISQVEETI